MTTYMTDYPGYRLYDDGRVYSFRSQQFLKPTKYGYVTLKTASGDYQTRCIKQLIIEYFLNNIHNPPDDIEGEEWKEIDKYPNYLVSNKGRVWSKRYDRILKSCYSSKGYPFVNIKNNRGELKCVQLHRLVAQAFLPNPEGKETVDHINHNRASADVEDLRWATMFEQIHNRDFSTSYVLPERRKRRGRPKLNENTIYNNMEEKVEITDPDDPLFWA